jgi:hypothetical protein
MVVSEYEDFLPAVTVLATGLLEPLTMASAIAFSRLAGRSVAVEEVVVVEVDVEEVEVEVAVGVAVGVSTGFSGSPLSCRLA